MNTGLTSTHTARGFPVLYHVYAQKQCITCSALCHKMLPYIAICYTDSRFFQPLELSCTALLQCRLLPNGLTSSKGCSLAMIIIITITKKSPCPGVQMRLLKPCLELFNCPTGWEKYGCTLIQLRTIHACLIFTRVF